MPAETNLSVLLSTMQPQLQEVEYVFCSVADDYTFNPAQTICFFREAEGITLVLPRHIADELQLPYSATFAWITLQVHSSLNAVGFTAAFSTALGNAGIGCNVVAAFYHDHIFVPVAQAGKAIDVLETLAGK